MRNTSETKPRLAYYTALLLSLTVLLCVTEATAEERAIEIVYPRPDQVVGAVDSTFIFGHLPNGLEVDPQDVIVLVNGQWTQVHKDGGFLAFVPITSGAFIFELEAYRKNDLIRHGIDNLIPLATGSVQVTVPQPIPQVPMDSLKIVGDYASPPGNLVLTAGERLDVMFRGTPGLQAWFSIEGIADSLPMSETEPRFQTYWGESVFGAGAVPDSLQVRGVYSGSVEIPDDFSGKDLPIVYHLAPPARHEVFLRLISDTSATRRALMKSYLRMPGQISRPSGYRISVNPPDYPFTVQFTDSVQIIRHAPRRGYFARFQPAGVRALIVGAAGDWYKARLSETQYAWVNKESVEPLAPGIVPPKSLVYSMRTYRTDEGVALELPLTGKHPFRVIEDGRRLIRLQLFGVTSDTDWIRYDSSDPLIDIITWSQPEPDLYEVSIRLAEDIWGFDTRYEGNSLIFTLAQAPPETWRLKGKKIVVDPGHSSDPGAIGPTGMTEAEANLGIALVLRHMLRAAGAEVIMTRDDDSHVELYDRPTIAKLNDADLFVSVHNNALPDGVNPFLNHGTSAYYYHPHSIGLARAIQKEMVEATGLPDHGLYHGNLAVNRPTQYPAVLVECAFMMIPEQEALLKTYDFRKKVAGAIMRGIENFLREYDNGRK